MNLLNSTIKIILENSILIPTAHAQVSAGSALTGAATTLGLDWKLMLAQIVNFAIVLFVLWKWVFTPLAKKLSERSKRIEESLKEAENIRQMHEQTEKERQEIIRQARMEASSIINSGQASAQKAKEEILAESKSEAERIMLENRKAIEDQRKEMLREVRRQISELVVTAAEKIIYEKLDSKKDRELIERNLKHLEEEKKA